MRNVLSRLPVSQDLFGRERFRAEVRCSALVVAVVLAIGALATSCAYYNTFFFARRYYGQAMRASQQASKATAGGSAAASMGVPSQVSSLLDKSIEKCAKVITFYPKSKWVDDAIYLMGLCYYNKQDYDRAIKKFDDLAVYYPKSDFVPRSVFMVGLCRFGKKEYDQTIEVLQKALLEYPRENEDERANAFFTLGEAYLQKKDYTRALAPFRLLAGDSKHSDLYFKSLLKAGQCYFELAQYDSARMCFSVVVRDGRNDEQVTDALIRTGDSEAAERSFETAIHSYEKALPLAEGFGRAPVVKLKIADAVLGMEKYEDAIKLYSSVATDFPRTPYASEAQFKIGYIYEVRLEKLDLAAEAYGKVKEHSARSEFASQAELRSKGLARLSESGKKPNLSEADKKAEAAFLLAELSLFQLGKPDKAIDTYAGVERDFPASAYAPKSAYAVAYALLFVKHDTTAAIKAGFRVIDTFPNTEYAEAAGEILKTLDVELPPEELQKTIPPEPVPADTAKVATQFLAGSVPADSQAISTAPPGTSVPVDSQKTPVAHAPEQQGPPAPPVEEGVRRQAAGAPARDSTATVLDSISALPDSTLRAPGTASVPDSASAAPDSALAKSGYASGARDSTSISPDSVGVKQPAGYEETEPDTSATQQK